MHLTEFLRQFSSGRQAISKPKCFSIMPSFITNDWVLILKQQLKGNFLIYLPLQREPRGEIPWNFYVFKNDKKPFKSSKIIRTKDEGLRLSNLLFNVSVHSLYDITWCVLNKLANYAGMDQLMQLMLLLQETVLPFRGTIATGKVSRCETCEVQIVWRGVTKEKSWIYVYSCEL